MMFCGPCINANFNSFWCVWVVQVTLCMIAIYLAVPHLGKNYSIHLPRCYGIFLQGDLTSTLVSGFQVWVLGQVQKLSKRSWILLDPLPLPTIHSFLIYIFFILYNKKYFSWLSISFPLETLSSIHYFHSSGFLAANLHCYLVLNCTPAFYLCLT